MQGGREDYDLDTHDAGSELFLNMLHSTMLTIIQLCEKQLPEATKLLYDLLLDNKYTTVAMETMTYFVNAQISINS